MFFGGILRLTKLHAIGVWQEHVCRDPFTKGMKAILLIAGTSLLVAWLPDIITSIARGTSLELSEVYTTVITYVFDIGIISPMMFLTYYLVEHANFTRHVLL